MNNGKSVRDHVYALRYTENDNLSPASYPGYIRIYTSNIERVTVMLQAQQELCKNCGRFKIDPTTYYIDVILTAKADINYIQDMLDCRINALRDEFYNKAVKEIGAANNSVSWIGLDEIGADLIQTPNGVEVRPVLRSLNPKTSTKKKIPSLEYLIQRGLVLATE